jgi:hypothetical protein
MEIKMPRIDSLYAYVIADRDEDDEGVPSIQVGSTHMPLMGSDMERMSGGLKQAAQEIADATGKEIKLIRSTGIEVLEVIQPNVPNIP